MILWRREGGWEGLLWMQVRWGEASVQGDGASPWPRCLRGGWCGRYGAHPPCNCGPFPLPAHRARPRLHLTVPNAGRKSSPSWPPESTWATCLLISFHRSPPGPRPMQHALSSPGTPATVTKQRAAVCPDPARPGGDSRLRPVLPRTAPTAGGQDTQAEPLPLRPPPPPGPSAEPSNKSWGRGPTEAQKLPTPQIST